MPAFKRLWAISRVIYRQFFLLFIFLTFSLVASSDAQDFGLGLEAYYNGNYPRAFSEFTLLAEGNHAEAQYYLGLMHEHGRGVNQNTLEAINWYSKAALYGFAEAGYQLGLIYEEGRGTPKEGKKAVFWYMRADALGSIEAKTRLAVLYMTGTSLEKNMIKAKQLITVAAGAGYSEAQYLMGLLCEQGISDGITQTEPNKREALIWYGRAAEKGHEEAILAVARLKPVTIR